MNTSFIVRVLLDHGFQSCCFTDSYKDAHTFWLDRKRKLKFVPVCHLCLRQVAEMPSKNIGCDGRVSCVRDLLACHAAQLLSFENFVSCVLRGETVRFLSRFVGSRSSGSSASNHMPDWDDV